ncbi:MAG: hypothetical protein HY300_17185 [Verrucomicrobia bacterium]|nr:hypothetical protein [Verrucomicrobiota bacterium]
MSAVSETIVREYFELSGFFVRQQRKFIAPQRREDDEIDFHVINPRYVPAEKPLPFVLSSTDLASIARAVVVVKGWHTDTFSPSLLANAPEIFRFVEPASLLQTAKTFGGDGPLTKILVVPALPAGAEAREASIEMLKAKGIDAIIPFHTMLADLIGGIEINRNYQKSDLLQVIRILKNYDFFREPQLELFKPRRKRK